MADKENRKAVSQRLSPKPREAFPDFDKCRVRRSGFGEYFDCLYISGWLCPHRIMFGDRYLCRHPSAVEILAHSAETKACEPSLTHQGMASSGNDRDFDISSVQRQHRT